MFRVQGLGLQTRPRYMRALFAMCGSVSVTKASSQLRLKQPNEQSLTRSGFPFLHPMTPSQTQTGYCKPKDT